MVPSTAVSAPQPVSEDKDYTSQAPLLHELKKTDSFVLSEENGKVELSSIRR